MGEIPRSDSGAAPRKGYQGSSERHRPILEEAGYGWTVKLTPIGGAAAAGYGRALEGGAGDRATFEVRAQFRGEQLPAFEMSRGEKVDRTEVDNYRDLELARAVTIAAAEQLRAGDRDIFLPAIAERLKS